MQSRGLCKEQGANEALGPHGEKWLEKRVGGVQILQELLWFVFLQQLEVFPCFLRHGWGGRESSDTAEVALEPLCRLKTTLSCGS